MNKIIILTILACSAVSAQVNSNGQIVFSGTKGFEWAKSGNTVRFDVSTYTRVSSAAIDNVLPMFEEGKSWEYAVVDDDNMSAPEYLVVTVEGDTVVTEKQAVRLRVHSTYPVGSADWFPAVTQQGSIIYMFSEEYDNFVPLMDFDAEPDQSLCDILTVADVKTVETGGASRRCITFQGYDPDKYWLEGIGTNTNLFITPLPVHGGAQPRLQRCYKDGECLFTAPELGGLLIFEYDGLFYTTSDGKTATLSYIDPEAPEVTVEASVSSHDISYTVTSIGQNVFTNTMVVKVTLPETILYVEKNAFAYCTELTSLTVKAEVPPTATEESFDPANFASCTLYVPEESVTAYAEADGWKLFERILPISSALSDAATDCLGAVRGEVYGTDGSLVRRIERHEGGLTAAECCACLPAGIYPVRLTDASGRTTTIKVAVR